MTKEEELLISVIAETLNIPPSKLAYCTGPGDIEEWDSLGHVRIITTLEKYYNISLDDDQLFEIESVEDLCEHFLRAESARNSGSNS